MPDLRQSIPRAPGKEQLAGGQGAWRLVLFFGFVFGVFFLSYLGLRFGYRNFLIARISDKDAELAALAADEALREQDEFLTFQYQLINLQKLLAGHVPASRLMPLFERNTNTQVQYSTFNFRTEDWSVDLSGIAASYAVVAEQLQAFQAAREISSFKITSARLREGGRVEFNATVSLDPAVFKF